MGLLQVDDDQVGERPFAQHAQFALGPSHRPGSVGRSQLQRLVGRQGQRIARRRLLEKRGRAQLLPHVEVVVRAGTVRGHRHRRSGRPQPLDGRHAAGDLHVALGIVGHDDAATRQRFDVDVGQMDAVGTDRPLRQQAQTVEVLDGRAAVTLAHDAHLVLRLGDVRRQAEAVAFARPRSRFSGDTV